MAHVERVTKRNREAAEEASSRIADLAVRNPYVDLTIGQA